MRFRFIQMSDLPDCAKLYADMLAERRDTELPYPVVGPQDIDAFIMNMVRHMLANPAWFAICGVVGSKIHEDAQGVKHVIGGRTKAFIAVSLSERTVGSPKNIAFTELLVVDKEFRQKDVARRLVQHMTREAAQRGAQVLECAWNPGSLGEELWLAAGAKPYRVLAAWITEDGTPRTDQFLAKKPQVEAEPAPQKRKRGRPRKQPAPDVTEGT